MYTNDYFEILDLNSGKKINISREIDVEFSATTHWHPFVEILVSCYDDTEVNINFKKYDLKTNDFVIIYPGDLHSLHNVSEDSFLLVQFPLDLLTIMNELKNIFSVSYQYHYFKYDRLNIESDRMILLIKELTDLYYRDEPFKEVRIYTLLLEFFIKLGQYCIHTRSDDFSGNTDAEYKFTQLMAEACLYISQNCTQPLTLDDISRHMGLSKSHFAHLFKKYTNMTFIDFLTTERIKRTEALILNPKAHIIDIAFDSGFSSISSFNRAFKKIKGVSPSKFRETMINGAF
ncbi:MAG: AraC family transcriptional regulator [Hespellia sp.]|nr:AraC family transcriptional regulator [Hespellia sp.]